MPCSFPTNIGKPSGSARHGSHFGFRPANREGGVGVWGCSALVARNPHSWEGNAGVNPLVGAHPPLIMRFWD